MWHLLLPLLTFSVTQRPGVTGWLDRKSRKELFLSIQKSLTPHRYHLNKMLQEKMNKKGPQSFFCYQRSCCPEQWVLMAQRVLEPCTWPPSETGETSTVSQASFTQLLQNPLSEGWWSLRPAPESLWQGWIQSEAPEASRLWHCRPGSSHSNSTNVFCGAHRQSLRQIFRCHCRQKP